MHKSVSKQAGKTQIGNSSLLINEAQQPNGQLRRLRTEAGLTQEELASASGLSVYSISGYEQKRFGMKVTALNRLADALALHLPQDSSELLNLLAEDHKS